MSESPTGFVPQLATAVSEAPGGPGWLHEIKLDGYRLGCRIDNGRVTLLTRQGHDWTSSFPEIATAAAKLPVRAAFLDGEAVVMLPDGHSDFHALQHALAGGPRVGLVYAVFDLIHLDGQDVAALPIEERKQRLSDVMRRAPEGLPLRYSDHAIGNGPAMFAEACRLGLEGIVSKQLGAPYRPGRSTTWLKVKGVFRQEVVVGGFTDRHERTAGGGKRKQAGTGTGTDVGALLCGTYDEDGRLVFAGKVGTGFSAQVGADLRKRLDANLGPCPFHPQPLGPSVRGAIWVNPVLVAEVAFSGWTGEGLLRHSSFLGLRADKAAREVRREVNAARGGTR
jgi:bifunctional non-homologous end joining protein LigD